MDARPRKLQQGGSGLLVGPWVLRFVDGSTALTVTNKRSFSCTGYNLLNTTQQHSSASGRAREGNKYKIKPSFEVVEGARRPTSTNLSSGYSV